MSDHHHNVTSVAQERSPLVTYDLGVFANHLKKKLTAGKGNKHTCPSRPHRPLQGLSSRSPESLKPECLFVSYLRICKYSSHDGFHSKFLQAGFAVLCEFTEEHPEVHKPGEEVTQELPKFSFAFWLMDYFIPIVNIWKVLIYSLTHPVPTTGPGGDSACCSL